MRKRSRIATAATGILLAGTGFAAFAASADASPSGPPSATVCAVWQGGRPYVGPVNLTTNLFFFGPGQTLTTGPNGCATFGGLVPGTSYQASVNQVISPCLPGTPMRMGTPGMPPTYAPNGMMSSPGTPGTPMEPGTPGVQGLRNAGASPWGVAPASGRLTLGRIVVEPRQPYSC